MVQDGSNRSLLSTFGQGIAPVALLGGVATNHDGRAATITAPTGTAQQRFGKDHRKKHVELLIRKI